MFCTIGRTFGLCGRVRHITSKAIVCHEFGTPEVMTMSNKEVPAPPPGQILVRIHAAGVNPSDTYQRLGPAGPWGATPHLLPELPFTPGNDGAGVITALGPDVAPAFAVGERVYTLRSISGTYAEHVLCDAADVYPLPENISFEQGACIGVPCSTAYRARLLLADGCGVGSRGQRYQRDQKTPERPQMTEFKRIFKYGDDEM